MSLIGEERKDYILNKLNLEGKVKSFELVEALQVSSETVRRYLEELEEEKKLKRVYGGAIKINAFGEEPAQLSREVMHAEEKKRIGKAAASLVEDNDVLFISDGTTSQQMIHYLLNKKNLTVLTVSISAMHLLMDYRNKELFDGDIYFIGGKVSSKHARVFGPIAEKIVSMFVADKAFIAIDGITLQSGITGFDVENGMLMARMIENAKQTVVLTDHSKIGSAQKFKIAEYKDIDIIISDAAMPSDWESELARLNVEWIRAE
ncbi:DeoR/GlpR family DNA-binding transcription regulator [Paenibacillus methanolicus]|uniref:DeoR/GlpR family transcriptional regulator of sugar metabolism n=1 Tax=Paenibacillus methanolicus TaxID=582686 RepID=A0A5S5CJ12_9BACL|nr:DeoR/GlpR family DNA-binding transcription regulator [Paenibacillus methanolicus]TYP79692.1 DeoR/GlpR family transcriptional regulator of sugar metabolism [Paenibacillus methanolicus]